jgi:hypothetical protein
MCDVCDVSDTGTEHKFGELDLDFTLVAFPQKARKREETEGTCDSRPPSNAPFS